MNKVTMQDIANQFNISINAVSIALNDKEGVSHQLRIQILEAAKSMGYPLKKLNAKDTLKNKTLVIMVEHKKVQDKYYLDFVNCIQKEAAVFGYRILHEYYKRDHFQVPKCIREHHSAGVIILGQIHNEMISSLKLYIQEIICVNHSIPYLYIDSIMSHDYLGGYMSCEYLIKKGCQRIGFMGDIQSSQNFKQRFDGYHQCMLNSFSKYEELSLTSDIEKAILNQDYIYLQSLLKQLPALPDAFVCVNDRNAALLIKALQYNGYKVPQDVKVIGFDNLELASKMKPTLTTLEISRSLIAKKAIRRIHEIIHEETIPETIMLSPQIIERESTQ